MSPAGPGGLPVRDGLADMKHQAGLSAVDCRSYCLVEHEVRARMVPKLNRSSSVEVTGGSVTSEHVGFGLVCSRLGRQNPMHDSTDLAIPRTLIGNCRYLPLLSDRWSLFCSCRWTQIPDTNNSLSRANNSNLFSHEILKKPGKQVPILACRRLLPRFRGGFPGRSLSLGPFLHRLPRRPASLGRSFLRHLHSPLCFRLRRLSSPLPWQASLASWRRSSS